MPGVRAAFVFSLNAFIQTDITHITVESSVLAKPANSTLFTMEGFSFHAGEMLTPGTKILCKLYSAVCAVMRIFVYRLHNLTFCTLEVSRMRGSGGCVVTLVTVVMTLMTGKKFTAT